MKIVLHVLPPFSTVVPSILGSKTQKSHSSHNSDPISNWSQIAAPSGAGTQILPILHMAICYGTKFYYFSSYDTKLKTMQDSNMITNKNL